LIDRAVFTDEKVNWPAVYSWIILDSRYMAKISAAANKRVCTVFSKTGVLQTAGQIGPVVPISSDRRSRGNNFIRPQKHFVNDEKLIYLQIQKLDLEECILK